MQPHEVLVSIFEKCNQVDVVYSEFNPHHLLKEDDEEDLLQGGIRVVWEVCGSVAFLKQVSLLKWGTVRGCVRMDVDVTVPMWSPRHPTVFNTTHRSAPAHPR